MEKRTKQVRVWLHQSVLQQTIKTIYFPTAEENKVEPTRVVVRDYVSTVATEGGVRAVSGRCQGGVRAVSGCVRVCQGASQEGGQCNKQTVRGLQHHPPTDPTVDV